MQGFLSSMVFATILSIGFGPIALIILRQSIACGFRGALPGALGAAVADAVFAAVAFYGLQTIKEFWLANNRLLTWVAIAYLFYLGGHYICKTYSCGTSKNDSRIYPGLFTDANEPTHYRSDLLLCDCQRHAV
ncbi:MAG: LysE family translocator [Pseudomonas veronii]|jgi:threonine/homoserine/homoserine lactone efflux protein|nr:LysE family translocator [Pseudomonas veronii]